MFNYPKSGFILLLALFSATGVQTVGGIALDTTRVIYPADAKQTSLSINNSDTKEYYLVNSWIGSSAGIKEEPFTVTPPLFVSEPRSENVLRIIYAGVPLLKDRESLFWMNVKAIPSVNENSLEDKNVLQLAILPRIELFAHPNSLPRIPENMPGIPKFSRIGNHLGINDLSMYYATLINLNVGGIKADSVMVVPRSDAQVPLSTDVQGDVTFRTANGYGAVTPVQTVSMR